MPTKNQFDFPTKKSYEIPKNPVVANKRGKNQENFDSSNLNWRRRMERSVIGRTTKEKSNMVLPTTTQCQLVPNSKKFSLYDVVHQIPDGVCQIHQNSSVLEKILRTAGLSPRRIGPLLGVQFYAEHSPGSKGGECEGNAIRA